MDRILVLDFRAWDIGGPVVPPNLYRLNGERIPASEELALLREAPAFTFLIHGFANGRKEGREKLEAFSRQVLVDNPEVGTCFLLVLWPGDNLLSPLTYFVEEKDAGETARRLVEFFLDRTGRPPGPCFVAHSLGCLVALEAMKLLHERGTPAGEVVLMAGAVDADALARRDRYRDCIQATRRIQVLSSKMDKVLRWCFPAGDFLASVLFGGYTTDALGRAGPRDARPDGAVPASVKSVPLQDAWQVGHGDYLAEADGTMNPKHVSAAHLVAWSLGGGAGEYLPP